MTDEEFSASVSDYLEKIEESLIEKAVADNPYTEAAARHILLAGGKRFRPSLVTVAAHIGDQIDPTKLVSAGVVVELTHAASLYHDDVMDEADSRRGVPSANWEYGNSVAILVGDLLFARASSEVTVLGVDYIDLQARTFAELVQGQIEETIGPGDNDPIEHHYKVIAGKTASLIRTSAIYGGMVGGCSDEIIEALANYGYEIGMVFQLSDDIIDITSDSSGKTPGTDLREGIDTLPILLLRQSTDPADVELVARIDAGLESDTELADVLGELRSHAVIEKARDEIRRRAEKARSYLDVIPEGPAKRALQRACDEGVTRSS